MIRTRITIAALLLAFGLMGAPASARYACIVMNCVPGESGECESPWVETLDMGGPLQVFAQDIGRNRGTCPTLRFQVGSPCLLNGHDPENCTRMSDDGLMIDVGDSRVSANGSGIYPFTRSYCECDTEVCVGGTNDNVSCAGDSECPGGTCGCRVDAVFCGGSPIGNGAQ